MRKSTLIISAVSLAIALSTGSVYAEEVIYGGQLMTQQERIEFRTKMRSANTYEQREQIRVDHHKAMQARAQTKGLTLPDMPPAMGGGMGSGMGPGAGRNR